VESRSWSVSPGPTQGPWSILYPEQNLELETGNWELEL
jgi:hypothetical protein